MIILGLYMKYVECIGYFMLNIFYPEDTSLTSSHPPSEPVACKEEEESNLLSLSKQRSHKIFFERK